MESRARLRSQPPDCQYMRVQARPRNPATARPAATGSLDLPWRSIAIQLVLRRVGLTPICDEAPRHWAVEVIKNPVSLQ